MRAIARGGPGDSTRVPAPTCALAALVLTAACAGAQRASGASLADDIEVLGGKAPRPNIILIVADDLGYGDVGAYGQSLIQTPYIDQLAREGARFTQFYAGSAASAPSRAVLLTGKHAGRLPIRGNAASAGPRKGGMIPLRAADLTMAAVLKAAGYATAGAGRWTSGDDGSTAVPTQVGFDEWYGFFGADAPTRYPRHLWHNGALVSIDANAHNQRGEHSDDLFTAFGLQYVQRQARTEQPFFLCLSYTLPHAPYDEPAIPDLDPLDPRPWPAAAKRYSAMVGRLDRYMGAMMELLDRLGLADRTMIAFTSDHGPAAAVVRWQVFGSAGGLRGHAGQLFEGGIRVPFVVRWPERIAPLSVIERPAHFADVLPTLAAVAGVPAPAEGDGESLVRALLGRERSLRPRLMYWELDDGQRLWQAVRRGRWKALRPGIRAPVQLYDMFEDAGEVTDRAGDNPDLIFELSALMAGARTDTPDWPAR